MGDIKKLSIFDISKIHFRGPSSRKSRTIAAIFFQTPPTLTLPLYMAVFPPLNRVLNRAHEFFVVHHRSLLVKHCDGWRQKRDGLMKTWNFKRIGGYMDLESGKKMASDCAA